MKITPIPTGTKDILPSEAGELRYLESCFREVFAAFGYGEVITPTLELESALEKAGERRFRQSFRLFDERGDVLVLRPDMTAPIARLAATRLADREPPFRLCYFANSFRPTRPQRGRGSEFYQAGLELLGDGSPAVDAEVLAIICRSLAACGLSGFKIVLGEASFLRALLDGAGVTGEGREAVLRELAGRDMVGLWQAVESLAISADDRQAIMDTVSLRGGSEVLGAARDLVTGPEMEAALKRLARTYYLVTRYGFAEHMLFDFGIFRNFDYYTGIVFEVLSADLGFPLGGGGRYDGLLARFGRPLPAVGFAVGLDRLHIAATQRGGVRLPEAAGAALIGGLDGLLPLAAELREAGLTVLALADDASEEGARRQAEASGLPYIVMPAGGAGAGAEVEASAVGAVAGAGQFRLIETASGDAIVVSREALTERIKG